MAEEKSMRLSQAARKLNVGIGTIVDFLGGKGVQIDSKPNTKVTPDQFKMLYKEFQDSAADKEEAAEVTIGGSHRNQIIGTEKAETPKNEEEVISIKNTTVEKPQEPEVLKASDSSKLQGVKVVGKIDLDSKPKAAKPEQKTTEPTPTKPEPKKEAPAPVAPAPEPAKPKAEPKKEVKPEVKVQQTPKVVQEQPKEQPAPPVDKKTEEKKEAPAPAPKAEKNEPPKAAPQATPATPEAPAPEKVISAKADKLQGLKVLGKIELPKTKSKEDPKKKGGRPGQGNDDKKKRKRVRIDKPVDVNREARTQGGGPRGGGGNPNFKRGGKKGGKGQNQPQDKEISNKEIQEKIKQTIAKIGGGGHGKKSNRSKYKRERRAEAAAQREEQAMMAQEDSKVLKVTEFISAHDLASLMNVTVNDVISACMTLGMFVSINQRLDAETITVITDEFGYEVEFTTTEEDFNQEEEEVEAEEDLEARAPIVTIMGHVDHGKTSLLDFIRESRVADKEAGGITQHIGAYSVKTSSGKKVAFLDTPGHEAFTAMRARGAKLTDIVILVVAADDRVMPQTIEAINHAQVAGVPMIVAINKVDKPTANPDKIREELSTKNILVEDWGGKYQCQEVSAKSGQGIEELLDKVLIEAELMELKANPNRTAAGTIVEASLDKGRGYLATVLVQKGTLNVGDIMVAGAQYGRVKAMTDHKGRRMTSAPPSTPVQVLGLDGAPQAGDKIQICETDREAREITNKRQQILREQSVRTKKHLTLDEIGRRLSVGNFKELNLIIKGDVDGSVEALTDSLLKLSTEQVQINVIHKAVGQISESDVLLATASDAIIVGFQVRPSPGARTLAETEEIEIKLYSVIYKAIDDVKDALEGMLDPEFEEVITGNIEIRETFKISKIGTIAGCMVLDGTVNRNSSVRIIREGIVIHDGVLESLKRFKDDVSEVKKGYECGLNIKGYNDIQIGDIIEAYEEQEIKKKKK